jgi:hypothetical protein
LTGHLEGHALSFHSRLENILKFLPINLDFARYQAILLELAIKS